MVFFNHSTMQMAAKIVYYGPGLCGKTTNLQHIYQHTSRGSRGEMVSLETDTDRTLFFDLLPLEVGTIQGFSTRIQLYTVPGQVFYNTTRKLVLKGVDGVVFVGDSQRAMLQANIESFANLKENLAEIGLDVEHVPLVLQYNKRDLQDICSVEELDRALNTGDWPAYESSAIQGAGVFDTLKAISKLTLLSLKRRLARSDGGVVRSSPRRAVRPKPVEPAATPESLQPPIGKPARKRGIDILAELERIRHQSGKVDQAPEKATLNGRRRIDDRLRFEIAKDSLRKARKVSLRLVLEDDDEQTVESFEGGWEVEDPATLEQLLLRLDIALRPPE